MSAIRPVTKMFEHAEALLKREFQNVHRECAFMDVFGFNENGDSCEIEIKTACYDLYKEVQKLAKIAKHTNYNSGLGFIPTRFYFMVLSNLRLKAERFIDKHGFPYGLITYDSLHDKVEIVRKSQKLSDMPFEGELNHYVGVDFKHKVKT